MNTFKNFKTFSTERKDSQLADRIKNEYLSIIDEFPIIKQQHFLSRLSKCYGNKWKSKLKDLGSKLAKKVLTDFESAKDDESKKAVNSFIKLRNATSPKIENKVKGNQWVKDNASLVEDFLAYLDVLMNFNIVCRLKCESSFDKDELEEIRNWLIDNWESQIDKVIKNPDIFSNIPVQAINVFYYMSSLKIQDPKTIEYREDEFLNVLKDEYRDKLEDEVFFINYLYALTHILIGESWFYEYKLPLYKEKFDWIIKFFKENRERILGLGSDIIAEIGVVLIICEEQNESEKYKKIIRSRLGTRNFIGADANKGAKEYEHTNILSIMLLKGF